MTPVLQTTPAKQGRMIRFHRRVELMRLDELLRLLEINPRRYDLKDKEQRAWALQDAEEVFKRRMKEAHPDVGGEVGHAADLSSVMGRVRHLIRRTSAVVPPTPRPVHPLSEDVCPACGQPFVVTARRQRVCSRGCAGMYGLRIRNERRRAQWSGWEI